MLLVNPVTTEDLPNLSEYERFADMHRLLKQARKLADDGNWPECYADDVSYLLKLLQRERRSHGH